MNIRYTSNIDQVYKNTKDETNSHLRRLQSEIRRNPEKFELDYMNLSSYIDDLQAEEEERKARKSFALE